MAKYDEIVKKAYDNKGRWLLLGIVLILGGVIFFFIGHNKRYVLYKDSEAYLFTDYRDAKYLGIMPGYCALIDCVRRIFGEKIYLNVIVLIQGVLAVIILIRFSYFIKEEFRLNGISTVLVFMLSTLPYCYSLPEEMATHAIMTESVCFSFFYIYIMHMLKGIFYESYKNILYAVIFSAVMTYIRKQHILLLIIGLLVIIYMMTSRFIVQKKNRVFILSLLGGMCIGLVLIIYIFWYPDKRIMAFDQITYSFAGKVIYMSEPLDAYHYKNQVDKGGFELLYQNADQEKMLYRYSESSGILKWQHAINGMNFTTRSAWSNLRSFCRENEYDDKQTMYIMKDIVFTQIANHPLRFIYITFIPIGQSLISSIFIKPDSIYSICAIISGLIYILSFIVYCYSNKLEVKDKRSVYTYIFTMIVLLSNVLILNIVFQSLQRYIVYTFGMFYIATYMNILTVYRHKRQIEGLDFT